LKNEYFETIPSSNFNIKLNPPGKPYLNYKTSTNNKTITDFFNNKSSKSPIGKSKVNNLVNSYFSSTVKSTKEIKDLHSFQKEI